MTENGKEGKTGRNTPQENKKEIDIATVMTDTVSGKRKTRRKKMQK